MLTWWLILLLLVYFGVILMLIGIILIQSGKGGGLSSLAQSSSGIGDAIGATGVEKTLNKLTTYVAVAFFLMAIGISLLSSARSGKRSASDILSEGAPAATAPVGLPEGLENSAAPAPSAETAPIAPSADLIQSLPAPEAAAPVMPAAESAPVEEAPAAEAAPVEPAPATEEPATP